MRLILTRHGKTIENEQGIMMGHLPGHLSELGKEQAKKLALRLKDEKIDFIYSSDLARAVDTAKEVARNHSDISLYFITDLRERNLGDLQGRLSSEVKVPEGNMFMEIPNGESLYELLMRAQNFLKTIYGKHKNETVLLVSHNGIQKAIICAIEGKNLNDLMSMPNLGNASVTIYEISNGFYRKVVFDS